MRTLSVWCALAAVFAYGASSVSAAAPKRQIDIQTAAATEPTGAAETGSPVSEYNGVLYSSHDEMNSRLKAVADKCEDITQVYSIGKSVEGRELHVIEFSTSPGKPQPGIPQMKYVGNMHGDELLGRELLIILAEDLCEKYMSKNETITQLISETSIHILPTMNPDGHHNTLAILNELDDYKDWCTPEHDFGITKPNFKARQNANMCDLNRNFPDRFNWQNQHHYQHCNTQPETTAVMDWINDNNFVLSANFHAGSIVVSYPFDGSPLQINNYTATPDDEVFVHLAHVYSDSVPAMNSGDVCNTGSATPNFTDGTTNGASWYSLYGSMQDWNYLNSDCFEITVEVSCCRNPPPTEIEMHWGMHGNALVKYIQAVHTGIKGLVSEKKTGRYIEGAIIAVEGIDHNVTTSPLGNYWRLLVPGRTYNMSVLADGFVPIVQRDVTVPDSGALEISFELTRTSDADIVEEEEEPTSTVSVTAAPNVHMQKWEYKHHGNDIVEEYLVNCSLLYPDITRLSVIGTSAKNTNVYALEISKNPGVDEALKPQFKYVANIHGDEVVGREVTLSMIHHLLTNYGQDDEITRLIDTTRIFLIPAMNPDGYAAHRRANGHGVDLNRNFPDQYCGADKAQPEVASMMDFILDHRFLLSISFHGGAVAVFYPYDDSPGMNCNRKSDGIQSSGANVSPDNKTFEYLAHVYADNHQTMYTNVVCYDQDPTWDRGTYNGNHWYPLTGGMGDWNYLEAGVMEVTIELTCTKWPDASVIETEWNNNRRAMLMYLKHVHMGVKGIVTYDDGMTPLEGAEVRIVGIDRVTTSGPLGDYFWLLTPGTYEIEFSMEDAKVRRTIDVPEQSLTESVSGQVVYNVTLDFKAEADEKEFPVELAVYCVCAIALILVIFVLFKLVRWCCCRPNADQIHETGRDKQGLLGDSDHDGGDDVVFDAFPLENMVENGSADSDDDNQYRLQHAIMGSDDSDVED
ncbi:hypothetical protein SARC_00051 [Sphaeroforma arctica JP610]|uniref:Peptidase M14 domain-containing protein n=1 Tax=Sphaeroforma arctica JP610 TaxID=667725 RepID=A0A0L0GHH3_9EUKA|nr:hypothetical protein SARC_00051 [Sphaeroforma arctica JP610]KNC87793.1 hypothetical protein SARC_00051 [Sphaeroforma arctica JP610]|eukprot:XP_014161695.1 hypothetical protein SARC_00051 [Sphaeroforma arctica JP610]